MFDDAVRQLTLKNAVVGDKEIFVCLESSKKEISVVLRPDEGLDRSSDFHGHATSSLPLVKVGSQYLPHCAASNRTQSYPSGRRRGMAVLLM